MYAIVVLLGQAAAWLTRQPGHWLATKACEALLSGATLSWHFATFAIVRRYNDLF